MKILHWYPNFLGGGGVANAVLGLAKAQCELGAEVIIASAEALKSPLYQFMDRNLGKVQLFKWKPAKIFHIGSLIWRIPPKNSNSELDYVGTRLHAYIRAVQHGKRAINIVVDDRGKEMGRDFNLTIVRRGEWEKIRTTYRISF